MGLSYTFNGHAIARAANDLSLHTDVVRSVLDAYLAEELRAAGVAEHTTSVTFSDRADALFTVPKKPSDIEVIAERLAKVEEGLTRLAVPADNFGSLLTRLDTIEQRQDEFEQRTIKALNAHDERFDTQSELRIRSNPALDQRIDKVAEIIGERVSGLVDQLDALAQKAGSVEVEHSEKLEQHSRDIGRLLHLIFDEKPAPAFPTGGAHTLEGAAEAVLPVPQRGDRVRLEGAKTLAFYSVPDGWYEVAGQNGDAFQIRVPQFGGDWLPYITNAHDGLKEVKANGTR